MRWVLVLGLLVGCDDGGAEAPDGAADGPTSVQDAEPEGDVGAADVALADAERSNQDGGEPLDAARDGGDPSDAAPRADARGDAGADSRVEADAGVYTLEEALDVDEEDIAAAVTEVEAAESIVFPWVRVLSAELTEALALEGEVITASPAVWARESFEVGQVLVAADARYSVKVLAVEAQRLRVRQAGLTDIFYVLNLGAGAQKLDIRIPAGETEVRQTELDFEGGRLRVEDAFGISGGEMASPFEMQLGPIPEGIAEGNLRPIAECLGIIRNWDERGEGVAEAAEVRCSTVLVSMDVQIDLDISAGIGLVEIQGAGSVSRTWKIPEMRLERSLTPRPIVFQIGPVPVLLRIMGGIQTTVNFRLDGEVDVSWDPLYKLTTSVRTGLSYSMEGGWEPVAPTLTPQPPERAQAELGDDHHGRFHLGFEVDPTIRFELYAGFFSTLFHPLTLSIDVDALITGSEFCRLDLKVWAEGRVSTDANVPVCGDFCNERLSTSHRLYHSCRMRIGGAPLCVEESLHPDNDDEDNLLRNGDWDRDVDGWTVQAGTGFSYDRAGQWLAYDFADGGPAFGIAWQAFPQGLVAGDYSPRMRYWMNGDRHHFPTDDSCDGRSAFELNLVIQKPGAEGDWEDVDRIQLDHQDLVCSKCKRPEGADQNPPCRRTWLRYDNEEVALNVPENLDEARFWILFRQVNSAREAHLRFDEFELSGARCAQCRDGDEDGFEVGPECEGQRDCNDLAPQVHPGAEEVCDNGVDEDCDGAADEGCEACQEEVCNEADDDCDARIDEDLECECLEPAEETCDGTDEDCDGQIDEDTSENCYAGPEDTEGVGVCEGGLRICEEGALSECIGETLPSEETCNGLDDDCDGAVDEIEDRDCYSGPEGTLGVGACAAGRQSCSEGAWTDCEGETLPAEERCEGTDQDCDGATDEGEGGPLQQDCYSGPEDTLEVGLCVGGTETCVEGEWGECAEQVVPGVETCDGRDEDCDGDLDEGFQLGAQCVEGQGVCRREGVRRCDDAGGVECSVEAGEGGDEICDGLDNDCDGASDEGFDLGAPCAIGVGACRRSGSLVCVGEGAACSAAPGAPVVELCDGLDNDCDGLTDEGGEVTETDFAVAGDAERLDPSVGWVDGHIELRGLSRRWVRGARGSLGFTFAARVRIGEGAGGAALVWSPGGDPAPAGPLGHTNLLGFAVELDAEAGQVRVSEAGEVLASAPMVIARDAWHPVEVRGEGGRVTVRIDGALVVEAAVEGGGAVRYGFTSGAGAPVDLDDLSLRTFCP